MVFSTIFKKQSLRFPELPSLLFIYLVIGLLSIRQSFLLNDLDVCWLIRTGELILQTGNLPESDIFSFTYYGKAWVLYQWGFEIFLGGLHLLAGLGGVIFGVTILIALAYSLLFNFLLRTGIHRGICIGLVSLTMLANSFHWLARPNTASILFYITLITILENYRNFPNRRIFLLVFLFIFWANIHLGFIFGLLVLFIYALWAFLIPNNFRPSWNRKDYKLLFVFTLCLIATLINPYGFQLFSYLWDLSQATNMNAHIGELHSPNFHSPRHFAFIIQLILLFWFGGINYSGKTLFLTIMCITLIMGLYSARHIPYFSVPASIHIAYSLKGKEGELKKLLFSSNFKNGWGWGFTVFFLCFIWVILIYRFRPEFYYFSEKKIPIGATKYFESVIDDNEKINILSTGAGGQWNDYFLYRFYPRVRVFIDTRFDMYGDTFFKNYLTLRNNLKCDLSSLKAWDIDFLVLKKNKKIESQINLLLEPLDRPLAVPPWKLVFEDEQAIIYHNQKQ